MSDFLGSSLFFGAAVSLLFYEMGLLIKKRFKLAVLNPLLLAAAGIIVLLLLLDVDYAAYNEGAKYISYLLTPATVALAVPLYEQVELLKKNWAAVLSAILAGTLASLACITLLCRIFALEHTLAVSFLPKSITTAIGMGLSQELGGVPSLTVAAICITGILGNVCAEGFFKLIRIHEPIAKGLTLGTASHAIGTSRALEMGEVEGAMSSLSIAVAGLLTVVLAPFFVNLV